MKNKIFIYIVFLLLILSYGCDVSNSSEFFKEKPYVVGEIIEVKERSDGGYSIRVAAESWAQQPPDDFHSIWFILTDRSEILKETKDRNLVKNSAHDLEVGQNVQCWPRGDVIATIYLQAEAGRIVVVEE